MIGASLEGLAQGVYVSSTDNKELIRKLVSTGRVNGAWGHW